MKSGEDKGQSARVVYRRAQVILLVATTLATLAPTAPASATASSRDRADASSVTVAFRCEMSLPVWPTPGGGPADCNGTGVTGACVCPFGLDVTSYDETCTPGWLLPPTGFYRGTWNGNTFAAMRVGTELYFLPGGTVVGRAQFLPAPPLPTCGQPGPLGVSIVGQIASI